jgi:ABC-type transport system substrate-binding protein/sugar lactone lactonase YvrE
VVAAVLVLTGAAVFALIRRSGSDGLEGIDEGAVGVIDAGDATISAQYRHVTSAPRSVAGGGGSVWVANPTTATVVRIGADRHETTTIPVGGSPSALAFDGHALWVADEDAGEIAQVDPATDRVVARTRVGNGPRALAVGHGALWVADSLDGEVVRIDRRTGGIVRIAAGGLPVALAVGPDAVWAATEESGRVVRIDPRTGAIAGVVEVGNGPSAVAVGAGAVWTANRQDGTVSRVDPATDREVMRIPAGDAPAALAIAGGSVWVAGDDAVGRLDPRRNRIVDTVTTHSAPAGLATIDGAVWVTGAAPAAAHRGGTLRIGRSVFDADPAKGGYDPSGAAVFDLLYDGLVHYRRAAGAAGARLVPGLAVTVPEAADGGRRYVFRLRRGGRYSDGTPVRAGDVRASIERMLMIQGRNLPPLYDAIVGAAGCWRSSRGCDLARGIVTDERARTVTFRLSRPDPELVQKLTLPLAAVLPARTPRQASAHPIPGTGPYRVARVARTRHGRRVLLTRNPRFRAGTAGGRSPGFVDRFAIDMDDDRDRQLAAFGRGELDIAGASDLSARRLALLRSRYGARLRSGAYAKTVYAWMNVHAAPFDDPRVRRALNLAVDRAGVVDSVGGPIAGSPTCQLLPSGFAGYRPTCPFTAAASAAAAWVAPDRARARALVAASGRRGTRVAVWTTPQWRGIGAELASALRELGLRPRLRELPGLGEIIIAAHDPAKHPQIGLAGWIADWPEPAGFLSALISCEADTGTDPRGVNLSQYCDHEVDAAIARARAAGPAAGRAWLRIEQRLADDAPVVPLMNGRYPIVTSPRTGNVQFHPIAGPLLDQVWVR